MDLVIQQNSTFMLLHCADYFDIDVADGKLGRGRIWIFSFVLAGADRALSGLMPRSIVRVHHVLPAISGSDLASTGASTYLS